MTAWSGDDVTVSEKVQKTHEAWVMGGSFTRTLKSPGMTAGLWKARKIMTQVQKP